MQLYHGDHGARPSPRAVRMSLIEKQLVIPMRDMDNDGSWIAETGAIFQYLEETHPEPALVGSNAEERAEKRMWQRRIERRIHETSLCCFPLRQGF